MKNKTLLILAAILCCHWTAVRTQAQSADSLSTYTETHPLIYEDAWDLWPYTFLNEQGEPDGYNIDLLRLMMKELGIPYTVKLKPTGEARKDLKDKRSHLMLSMHANYTEEFAQFGQNTINLFTHSLVMPKDMESKIRTATDLKDYDVIVHTGSFSHHYIEDRQWAKSIKGFDDMKDAIRQVSSQNEGIILWNTMSLKWLMRKYQTENLKIVPIELPYGEYKFMSNDTQLLSKLDSVYSLLRSRDEIQPLLNKWFYPERHDSGIPSWIWNLITVFAVIAVGILIYYITYRIRERKMTEQVRRSNERLSLILTNSDISFWTYNVHNRTFNVMNEKGESKRLFTFEEFSRRYDEAIFNQLKEALNQIIKKEKPTVTLRTRSTDDGESKELHDYIVTLSVLQENKTGQPTVILCTRSEITDDLIRQRKTKDMMLRYQSIFNNAMVDMIYYDQDGYISDMNERACKTFNTDLQTVSNQRINVRDSIAQPDLDLNQFEYYHATEFLDAQGRARDPLAEKQEGDMVYEMQLVPVFDESHRLEGIFGSGRNVTEVATTYQRKQEAIRQLQAANENVSAYIRNIDNVLTMGGVRMAKYDTVSHTLTIYSEIEHAVYSLTQTRALSLVNDQSKKQAQRLFNSLDNQTNHALHADLKTTLRLRGGIPLYLQVHFIPLTSSNGDIKEYFGMCRDISDLKVVEEKLAQETLRAQEVETVKKAFLRNMSYEIRTPLNTVVGFAELFQMEHSPEDEEVFINEIKENSSKLLKLINDILFLSRLDAGMIEIKPRPVDFATVFESRCENTWGVDKRPDVSYKVKNPYQRLMVEIDEMNFFIIIEKIIQNAVQYTTTGSVIARYDYIGDMLVVSVEDTGCGIPASSVEHIFERFVTGANNGAGLGLSICHELIQQMGGTINLKSTEGHGTTVWVSLPCKATDIVLKEKGGEA